MRSGDYRPSQPLLIGGLVLLQFALAALIGNRVLAGKSSFVNAGDAFDQSYMWLHTVFAAARQHQVALWDFTTHSGVSFIGEQQTAPLYPLAVAFGWLGGDVAAGYDRFLLLHFAIAAIGASLLLRLLGLSVAISVLGSLLFAYTGSFADRVLGQPNLFSSLAYLPWVSAGLLLLVSGHRRQDRVAGFILGAGAAALSMLAGHLHAVAIGMVSAVVLTVFRALPTSLSPASVAVRTVLWGLAVLMASLLLSLPQVVATHEYLRLVYKWNSQGKTVFPHVATAAEFAAHSLRLTDFTTLLGRASAIRDGGSLFFTLTGLALVCALPLTARHLRPRQTFAVYGALALLALSLVFAFGWIYPHLPMVNLVRQPTRWLFATGMALAVLASFSMAGALNFISRSGLPARKALALAAVCIIGLAIIAEIKGDFGRRIERPGWSENNAFAALRTPVLAALRNEMGKHLDVYRYHAPSELIPPNLGNVEFALGSHGHRSTRTIKYHDYFDFNPTGERLRNLGVRWWVTKEKVADLREVWSDGEVRIYERADALTVLWTVDATGRKMAAAIKDVQWSQNRVTFGLDRPLVGTVFFAQAFYPGFRANTEHGPEEVREADSLMRVEVAQPAESISFEYRPAWWGWSVALAVAAWISLLSALCWYIVISIKVAGVKEPSLPDGLA